MRRLLFLIFAGTVAPLACTSGVSVFGTGAEDGGNGGTDTTSSSGGAATTSSSGGAATTSSSGGAATTSSSGGAATASSSGGSSSAETTTSTATSSSSGGGGTSSIPCSAETCTGGEVCCVHHQTSALDTCAPPGTCGVGYLEVACNGPNDCASGDSCCGHYAQQGYYEEIVCEANCNNGPGYTGITMCGDDPLACDSGDTCTDSTYLPPEHSYCE